VQPTPGRTEPLGLLHSEAPGSPQRPPHLGVSTHSARSPIGPPLVHGRTGCYPQARPKTDELITAALGVTFRLANGTPNHAYVPKTRLPITPPEEAARHTGFTELPHRPAPANFLNFRLVADGPTGLMPG